MSDLQEVVDSLEVGDTVRGVFKELSSPEPEDDLDYFLETPTGNTYTSVGVVYAYATPWGTGLSISTDDQCLRQSVSGSPGGWLVSLEILKKGNA